MFKINEYFGGKVTSITFDTPEGKATVGVIAPGEYEFGTSTIEYMTVISGKIKAQLPGETGWKEYKEYETFIVPKDSKFKMLAEADAAYRCYFR